MHNQKIGSKEQMVRRRKETRMCSCAKISKRAPGSPDELRDSAIIILCMTQLSKDENFWQNLPYQTAPQSCLSLITLKCIHVYCPVCDVIMV